MSTQQLALPADQAPGARYASFRMTAVVAGLLFIAATVAALVAAALAPVLAGTDLLAAVSAHQDRIAAGALLYLIAAFTSVGIAIVLYPVLEGTNSGLALGSVIFRTLEAVMYTVAMVSLLSVVALGRQLTAAGSGDSASTRAVVDVLVSLRDNATLAGVFAFSAGAGLYYYLFFQSRLIPRWLSSWGMAATLLMLAACVMALFSDSRVTGYALLIVPIALQELVLAAWLIARGFSAANTNARTPSVTVRRAPLPPRWFIRTAWVVHRALYSVTRGRFGLKEPNATQWGMMRLHTVGRRSGRERVAILAYFEDGPNMITMAMNGWGEAEPGWWLNLQAQPEVTVELPSGPRAVRGRIAMPDERPRLWAQWAVYSGANFESWAARRPRQTAVVILEPRP